MENKTLKLLLGIILSFGNILNGGNGLRGQADGYSLETLGRVGNMTDKNKTSALKYIAKIFQEKVPEISIKKEFDDIYKAQRMNISDLATKVKALTDGFNGVKNRKNNIAKSMNEPDDFIKASEKFISDTEIQINKVNNRFNEITENHKKTCDLYRISQDDDMYKNTEILFTFFTKFFDQFNKILGEKKKTKRMPDIKKSSVNEGQKDSKTEAKKEGTIPKKATNLSGALSRLKQAYGKKDE